MMIMLRWLGLITALACLQIPALAQDTPAPLSQVQDQANSGAVDAQRALGLRYLYGTDVVQDFAQAAQWFERAANQNDPEAQNQLARLYFDGLGRTKNEAQALALFEQAATSGQPIHMADLARVLERDPNTVARAANLYTKAAKAGHIEATVSLGVLLQEGRGVPQDFEQARTLFVRAANAGNGRAMNNLGLLYVRAQSVEQDYIQAAALFESAAQLGVKQAFRNLGVLYENGFGVPLDEARAKVLYQQGGQGATQAVTNTQRYVYDPRLLPLGSTADVLTSLQSAAISQDPVAEFQLGWALIQSNDTDTQSYSQAAALFRSAADAGYGPAMANLGILYYRGTGVLQDYVLGHMWMSLARAAGTAIDPALALEFQKLPTTAQINESQTMIQEHLSRQQP